MSEAREVHHTTESVERVEGHAEPDGDEVPPEVAAVVAAEAGVALAETTAAAAELDAAERMRRFEEDAELWRSEQRAEAEQLRNSLQTLREVDLNALNESQVALALSMGELSDRMTTLEAHPSLQSTPQASEEASEETGNEEGSRIVGAEGTAGLGPVEASAGGGLEASLPQTDHPREDREGRKKNHRWI